MLLLLIDISGCKVPPKTIRKSWSTTAGTEYLGCCKTLPKRKRPQFCFNQL